MHASADGGRECRAPSLGFVVAVEEGIDRLNPVFLFSGQGSQKPGMGADLMGVPEVASSFECASDVLGYDLADLVATASGVPEMTI